MAQNISMVNAQAEVITASDRPTCVACGYTDSKRFWRDRNRTIRKCRACGLLFVFPQPDPTSLHSQFQSDYFAGSNSDGPTRLELEFEAWRKPALERIVQRLQREKPAGKLLDVGCASGEIFEHFRGGDWELYGIEPSSMAFERGCERFRDEPNVRLFNAYLNDLNFEPKSFDVIAVLESLFYMPNPRNELSHIGRILKDDGLLAIATPGYTYQRLRHSGLLSYAVHGSRCSLTASHLFYFSEDTLSLLLKSSGFQIYDRLQLNSSAIGSGLGRIARQTYLTLARGLDALTFGHVNLAPHVLYLCRKTGERN